MCGKFTTLNLNLGVTPGMYRRREAELALLKGIGKCSIPEGSSLTVKEKKKIRRNHV
jgi:hypothetical protein